MVRLPLFPPSAKVVLRHVTTEQLIYAGFTLLLIGLSANNARRLILPNVITIPGMLAGLVLSWLFPSLHGESTGSASLIPSGVGVIVGNGANLHLGRQLLSNDTDRVTPPGVNGDR